MPIPYLLTTLLFTFVALLAAADASLVSLNLVGAFPALRWVRVHFITLGILSQVIFGLLPLLVASLSKKSRPAMRWDLQTDCSCPDYSNPCKHITATHHILGERFDEDPFLIFRLRRRTQEQVMQELRKRRAGSNDLVEEEAEVITPLEEQIENFWDARAPFDGISVSIRPPSIEMPLLKRLGEANFVPEPGLQSVLSAAYQVISQKAIQAAFKDTSEEA